MLRQSPVRLAALGACVAVAACSKIDTLFSAAKCDGPTAYVAGSTVSGALGSACKGPTGRTGELYTMTLTQPTGLQPTVTTTSFNPLIGLYTASGKTVVEYIAGSSFKAFLPAGTYQLLVARTSTTDGAFTLATPAVALGSKCSNATGSIGDTDMGITTRGATIAGSVTATDCGAANAKFHWYRMRVATGDTVSSTITVDRTAGLSLADPTGTMVASKELSAAGTWSNTYVATADGWCILKVESRTANNSANLPLAYQISIK